MVRGKTLSYPNVPELLEEPEHELPRLWDERRTGTNSRPMLSRSPDLGSAAGGSKMRCFCDSLQEARSGAGGTTWLIVPLLTS